MHFGSYHPFINVLFFVAVIALFLIWNHPAYVAVAYCSAFIYSVKLNRVRGVVFGIALIPAVLVYAAWYATINHFGVTNLGMTIIGNHVTLESLVFGFISGVQFATVLMWASCVMTIFTTDKAIYLLGRIAPKLSLLFSIALRAVPVIKDRALRIGIARQGVGRGASQGNVIRRMINLIRAASILISWSIERFMQTSDSMRSRGSLLRGRSAYSIYRFDNRDRLFVVFLIFLLTIACGGTLLDQTSILYAPAIVMNHVTVASYFFYSAYGILCLLPMALQLVGEARFARQASLVEDGPNY